MSNERKNQNVLADEVSAFDERRIEVLCEKMKIKKRTSLSSHRLKKFTIEKRKNETSNFENAVSKRKRQRTRCLGICYIILVVLKSFY